MSAAFTVRPTTKMIHTSYAVVVLLVVAVFVLGKNYRYRSGDAVCSPCDPGTPADHYYLPALQPAFRQIDDR